MKLAMLNTLPTTAQLLTMGGDERIALDPQSGVNRYGCAPLPDKGLFDFASSTASLISEPAFHAADALRNRLADDLQRHTPTTLYARELARLRHQLLTLCELENMPEPDVIFAASGTDLHQIAARLSLSKSKQSLQVIMVDESETGSGVFAAMQATSTHIKIATVALRHADGTPRATDEIDSDFSHHAEQAQRAGLQVLLIQVDVSKTGMITPSYACTAALKKSLGANLDVLIDACQFRIAPATLRACLQRGYSVALTGSKFVGGPSFSGALLMPKARSNARNLDTSSNFGLLLRWEAALCELKKFRALDQARVKNFLSDFSAAIHARFADDPTFTAVSVPKLNRTALHANQLNTNESWDDIATIFPFQLYRASLSGRAAISAQETQQIYRSLALLAPRCQLGQPVNYGIEKNAMRLCLSAHLITQAMAGIDVIAQALAVLEQVSKLVVTTTGSANLHQQTLKIASTNTRSKRVAHG